jgi:hypothetical protein
MVVFTPDRISFRKPGTGVAAAVDDEKPKMERKDRGPAVPPGALVILSRIGINPGASIKCRPDLLESTLKTIVADCSSSVNNKR